MEQVTKGSFDHSGYNPFVWKAYKIMKKLVRYSLYIALLFFAYKGFMDWE